MWKHLAVCIPQLLALLLTGCHSETEISETPDREMTTDEADSRDLDFSTLIGAIDAAIGKRQQATQMDGMQSVMYDYDGPIETVLKIVEPLVQSAGFTLADVEMPEDMRDEMGALERAFTGEFGIQVKYLEKTVYAHADGRQLAVSQMHVHLDAPDTEYTTLTIDLTNSSELPMGDATLTEP